MSDTNLRSVRRLPQPVRTEPNAAGVEWKLVEDLYGQAPTIVLGSSLLYAINSAAFWDKLPVANLVLWTLIFAAATGARIIVWRSFRRAPRVYPARVWRRAMVAIHGGLGACWSCLAISSVIHLPPEFGIIAIVNLAGVVGSSVATASASIAAFRAIVLTGLLPLGLVLLAHESMSYRTIGAMTVAYMFVISSASRRVHETIRQSVEYGQVNQELVETLENLSATDALTGLMNRRGLEAAFSQIQHDSNLHARSLGVLLCDVDYFKAYNDRLGHLPGDECLRRVAQALQDAMRHGDLVGRFGGEEFAVLVPDCDPASLEAIAHRVCESVRRADLAHPASPVAAHVTISVGAAMAPCAKQAERAALLGAADRALYGAKNAGRDGYLMGAGTGR